MEYRYRNIITYEEYIKINTWYMKKYNFRTLKTKFSIGIVTNYNRKTGEKVTQQITQGNTVIYLVYNSVFDEYCRRGESGKL